jgi:hypothetical protein
MRYIGFGANRFSHIPPFPQVGGNLKGTYTYAKRYRAYSSCGQWHTSHGITRCGIADNPIRYLRIGGIKSVYGNIEG